jgi:hypothetical protein
MLGSAAGVKPASPRWVDNKSGPLCADATLRRCGGGLRKEVDRMLSARVKLALLTIASIVGAALVGGESWGP